jgi:hydroxysqualene dehydroxylase
VLRIAVVGAGWAGLSAAVRATQAGHAVTVFEMAHQPGGRARRIEQHGAALDNGQHILIGAYTQTLDLMRTVGADPQTLLQRQTLELRYPDGRGLRLPPGPAIPAFARAVLGCVGWSWGERIALLRSASGWALRGFRCDPALSVTQLCNALPRAVHELLIEPLCVAALNTPAHEASASVFLRVLRDALFSGPGSADLLLPRALLGDILPAPAWRWLEDHGATLRCGQRVQALERTGSGWALHGGAGGHRDTAKEAITDGAIAPGTAIPNDIFDSVVLACTANEAARLVQPFAPEWAALAASLRYEPIVTVYVQALGARLPCAMTSFASGQPNEPVGSASTPGANPRSSGVSPSPADGATAAPAQFAFDLGALGGAAGRFSFVISGAAAWVALGAERTGQAVLRQAQAVMLPREAGARVEPTLLAVVAEKRATFRCTPGLLRPAAHVAEHLFAAGDYVAGPYPATLEGAVRSGAAAISRLTKGAHRLQQPG